MTQKEKLARCFIALTSIKHSAERIVQSSKDFDSSFALGDARSIINVAEEGIKMLR